MNDPHGDPIIDPTPPVQRFAAHYLVLAGVVLGAILGGFMMWALGGH